MGSCTQRTPPPGYSEPLIYHLNPKLYRKPYVTSAPKPDTLKPKASRPERPRFRGLGRRLRLPASGLPTGEGSPALGLGGSRGGQGPAQEGQGRSQSCQRSRQSCQRRRCRQEGHRKGGLGEGGFGGKRRPAAAEVPPLRGGLRHLAGCPSDLDLQGPVCRFLFQKEQGTLAGVVTRCR